MILYLDCSSGISGDMLAGALLSLAGAREADPGPFDDLLRPALAAAGIDPRLVQIEDVRRGGFAALAFKVADQPGFATFDELIVSLYASDLEQPAADAVASIAERMAAAEAEVHGRGEDEEHLHELSDVDTAVDLICAVTLLAKLAPEQHRRLAAGAGRRRDRDGARPAERARSGRALPARRASDRRRRAGRAGRRDAGRTARRADHADRRRPARPLRRGLRRRARRPRRARGLRRRPPRGARPAQRAARRARRPGRRPGRGGGRSGGRLRCGRGVPGWPRPRRPRRPRGQHRRHDAGAAGTRRQRAARVRRARRVDEPGADEEGPARRGPARPGRRGRPRTPRAGGLRRDLDVRPARRVRATASTSRSGGRASRSASSRSASASASSTGASPPSRPSTRTCAAWPRPSAGPRGSSTRPRSRRRAAASAAPEPLSSRSPEGRDGCDRRPRVQGRSGPPDKPMFEIDRFCATLVESRTRRRISPPVTVRPPASSRRAG